MKNMKKAELNVNYNAYEKAENILKDFRDFRRAEIDRLIAEIKEAEETRGKERAEIYIADRERQIATLDEMYTNLTKWRDRYCYR